MAHPALIRLVLAGVLAVVACIGMLMPLSALAYGFVSKQQVYKSPMFQACDGYPSAEAAYACDALAWQSANSNACWSVSPPTVAAPAADGSVTISASARRLYCSSGLSTGDNPVALGGVYRLMEGEFCPANSVQAASGSAGGACRCKPGYSEDAGGGCEPYTCPSSGSANTPENVFSNASRSLGYCLRGCRVTGQAAATGVDGKHYVWGPFSYDGGGTCEDGDGATPNVPPSPEHDGNTGEPAPQQCPKRQCPGTVNGQAVCVPCDASEAPTSESSASSPTGTAQLPGAPAGATSSKTQTTCSGSGSCTTTTTYYDGGGNVVGQISNTEGSGEFCAKNASSKLCEGSEDTSFSGDCASSFRCTGDAVQCAMAREQHRRNCQLIETPTPLSELGAQAASGEAQPIGHPGRDLSPTTFSFSSLINQDDGGLGGGCPSDVAIAYVGHSLTIPFSKACGAMQTLGQIAVACSMLSACFIVFRS